MTIPAPVKIFAALLPLAVSPLIYALGEDGRSGFIFGLLLGAFFGITQALPPRRAA